MHLFVAVIRTGRTTPSARSRGTQWHKAPRDFSTMSFDAQGWGLSIMGAPLGQHPKGARTGYALRERLHAPLRLQLSAELRRRSCRARRGSFSRTSPLSLGLTRLIDERFQSREQFQPFLLHNDARIIAALEAGPTPPLHSCVQTLASTGSPACGSHCDLDRNC
jgi:hypothetical protein